MTRPKHRPSAPPLPIGSEAAATLLKGLFPPEARGFAEVRIIDNEGVVRHQRFLTVGDRYSAYLDWTRHAETCDVLVGAAPRSREEGTKSAVDRVHACWIDIDQQENVHELIFFPCPPSYIAASGSPGHLHIYWFLREAVDPQTGERLNRELAERFGGDVAVAHAAAMMRLPGTYNFKGESPVKVEMVDSTDYRYTVEQLEQALADVGTTAENSATDEAQPSHGPTERVLALLEGVTETGNGWQAHCPAHDDHNPSLSISEGEDGSCLLKCHAGCSVDEIVDVLGLRMSDLFHAQKRSVAAELVAIAEHHGAKLFHDPGGQPFASIPVGRHREVVGVMSRSFRRWLRRHFHRERGGVANSQAVADAVDLLCAIAEFEGEERDVFARVAPHGNGVVVDLADDEWRVALVGPRTVEILHESPVAFIRGPATMPLPDPVLGGSLDDLRPFVNLVDEGAWRLLVTFLVAGLIGRGPFVVLILQGEKGSGKSTTARAIRTVIDPAHPALRGGSPDERELMIAARTSWVVAFDNLSGVSNRLSDFLCRLSTGAGFGTRRLYTDDEEVVFDAMRPVLLNGIADIATRPDLLSRSIVLELPVLDEATTLSEADFYDRLAKALPRIFGALLRVASEVLAVLPEIAVDRSPRMADFARIGVALEKALAWPEGSFLAAYGGRQAEAYGAALDADPLAAVLVDFMRLPSHLDGWQGTATELLASLTKRADDEVKRRRNWPASASALGKRLKELVPALRPAGLEIEWVGSGRGASKQRCLHIFWVGRGGDAGDGGDGE